jgi:hypothetical protein
MSTTVFQGEYFSIHLDATDTEYAETGNQVLVVQLTIEGEGLCCKKSGRNAMDGEASPLAQLRRPFQIGRR